MKYNQRLHDLLGRELRLYINLENYLLGELLEVGDDYLLIRSYSKSNDIYDRLVQFDTIWWIDVEVAEIANKNAKDNLVNKFNKLVN